MQRIVFLLAAAMSALLIAGAPAAFGGPNPCPGPYAPARTDADPSYPAFDLNMNLQVCVATNKHAKPQIKDDVLRKK